MNKTNVRPSPVPAPRVPLDGFVRGARNTDPVTSHTAAEETGIVRRGQREALLKAFEAAGAGGLTDEEAAKECGYFGGLSCWWRRCTECRAEGRIEFTEETRLGEAGRPRRVSVYVEPENRRTS